MKRQLLSQKVSLLPKFENLCGERWVEACEIRHPLVITLSRKSVVETGPDRYTEIHDGDWILTSDRLAFPVVFSAELVSFLFTTED
jgi:hypothetical protein